jgi:hypothetical protein
VREKYNICLFESGLFSLTWCSLVPSIFLKMTDSHSSLWLTNTSLCVGVCVCVYTYIYIKHFLIHSWVHGHLDWFSNLAILNSAAINMGVQVFIVCLLGFLRVCTKQWCNCIIQCDSGNLILIYIADALIYIPTNSVWVFFFLKIISNIYCFLFSWW